MHRIEFLVRTRGVMALLPRFFENYIAPCNLLYCQKKRSIRLRSGNKLRILSGPWSDKNVRALGLLENPLVTDLELPSKNTCRYPLSNFRDICSRLTNTVPCPNRGREKVSEIQSECRSVIDSEVRTRPLISLNVE